MTYQPRNTNTDMMHERLHKGYSMALVVSKLAITREKGRRKDKRKKNDRKNTVTVQTKSRADGIWSYSTVDPPT